MLFLVLMLAAIPLSRAASCGSSAMPFRFEVLPSGNPVLGCATPSCFGGGPGGSESLSDAIFQPSAEGEDGFLREGDQQRTHTRLSSAPAQQAQCPSGFESNSCSFNDRSWVGGFLASPDGSLRLQCCTYDGMRFAEEVGRPIVHSGEVYSGVSGEGFGFVSVGREERQQCGEYKKQKKGAVAKPCSCLIGPMQDCTSLFTRLDIGHTLMAVRLIVLPPSPGEVLRDGRQTGFDLISNIKKIDAEDGTTAYELTVMRMNCLPDPAEPINDVALDPNDISRILDKVGEVRSQPTGEAQQPPLSDSYEVPVNEQPAAAEEIVQVGEQVIPVTSAGFYYPVASGVPACFTGDTMVETPSGMKRMDLLKIGDLVLTAELNSTVFTPVTSFLHRLPDTVASFIRLQTEDGELKLTPQHFIYKVSFEPVY
ncbi:intein splicing region, partial [Ostertagia ostertagi]